MAERTIAPPVGVAPEAMVAGSPPARRLRTSSWFDLRLVLGVLMVLVSVVLGARIVGAADSSVRVWALTQDLAAGTTLTAGDVRSVQVRLFSDGDRYVRVADSPTGRTLNRRVGRGELLPRAALTHQAAGRLVSLPVPALHAPDSLRRGQLIDVFATTKTSGAAATVQTVRVLAGVVVQAVRIPRAGLASTGTDYAVLVSVPAADVEAIVAAIRTADIDIIVVTGDDQPAEPPRR